MKQTKVIGFKFKDACSKEIEYAKQVTKFTQIY